MKKQITFQVTDTSAAIEATRSLFIGQGFKVVEESEERIVFSKGSVLQNVASFNPLNWKSRVEVLIQNNTVNADFDINTTGQLVTPREESLWDTFVQKYQQAVVENVDVKPEISRELKGLRINTWKYVLWAFVGGLIVGAPFAFVAYLTGIDMLAPMGAAGGAILFMMNRINNDRQKNSHLS